MTGNEIKRKVENFRGVCAPKFGDFFFLIKLLQILM